MKKVWAERVVAGRGAGRQIGFPTINLNVPAGWQTAPGVYAARVFLDEEWKTAALFFGRAATFGITVDSLELHILDWAGAAPIELQFELVKQVREIRQFKSVAGLVDQIGKDLEMVRKISNQF